MISQGGCTHPVIGHPIVVTVVVTRVADAITVGVKLTAIGDETTVVGLARRLLTCGGQRFIGDAVQIRVFDALFSIPNVSDRALEDEKLRRG